MTGFKSLSLEDKLLVYRAKRPDGHFVYPTHWAQVGQSPTWDMVKEAREIMAKKETD